MLCFMREKISLCQKEIPSFKPCTEFLKMVHQLWSRMTPEEKSPYHQKTAYEYFKEEFSKPYGEVDDADVRRFWSKLNSKDKERY